MSEEDQTLLSEATQAQLLDSLDELGYDPLREARDADIEEEADLRGLLPPPLAEIDDAEIEEESERRGLILSTYGLQDGVEQAYLSMHSADKTAFNEWAEKAVLLFMGRAV